MLVEKKSSGRLYALKLLEKSRMARQGALLLYCSAAMLCSYALLEGLGLVRAGSGVARPP